MKIWVDDIRTPPDDTWTWFKTSADCLFQFHVMYMSSHKAEEEIEVISLDHDLGGDDTTREIVKYMCYNDFWPVEVRVHSANPPGAYWLESMIERYHPSNAHKYKH